MRLLTANPAHVVASLFAPVFALRRLQCRVTYKLSPVFCFLLLFALSRFGCTLSFAQTTNANLTGRVLDSSSAAIPGARVEVIGQETGVHYPGQTNNEGIYFIPNLPPSIYRIEVSKQNFKTIIKPDVTLHVQDTVAINFTLPVGASSESVTVTAGSNNINTTDATVSTVVDRQFVENIPLNGRTLQSLITLTPGVLTIPGGSNGSKGEFSVNGQRTEANYYAVDGVSGNTGVSPFVAINQAGVSGSTPTQTQLGTTQSLIPLDALQEFRATTSTYSAEYGRTPGGQFSFVSRSGTKAWHGSAFDYFRNEALDANNWFSDAARIPKTAERQNDFGGTLGGPLSIPGLYNGKDRTFFFFSYEGLRLQLPAGATTNQYPDASLRRNAPAAMEPFLKAFPVPNGPEVLDSSGNPTGPGLALFTAAFSNPSNLDSVGIRVDHNLTKSTRIFGRYFSTSSASDSRLSSNLASTRDFLGNIKGITVGATTAFNGRLVNELRFNYTRNDSGNHYPLDNFGGAQPFRLGQVPGFGGGQSDPLGESFDFFLGFAGVPILFLNRSEGLQGQWNVTDAVTFARGAHVLKFGVDYRRLSTYVNTNHLAEAGFFSSEQQVLAGSPGFSSAGSSWPEAPEPVYTNFSAYAQDEWRASRGSMT